MPLYLDDVEPGTEWVSAGRTVTEADIINFAGLSGDFNLLHTNEEWVRENTPFSGRIAHGMLVLSISSGLRTPGLDDLVLLAYVDVQRRMAAPTYAGDTIHARFSVNDVRPSSSRPGTGLVNVAVEVRNQRDEVVQQGTDVYLVAQREVA